MIIDATKLGPWTQAAMHNRLTPELVELCLKVDINTVLNERTFMFRGYEVQLLPDFGIFYINSHEVKYESIATDLFAFRKAVMTKELNIVFDRSLALYYERLKQGKTFGLTTKDGIEATFWAGAPFASLSFNFALGKHTDENKIGVQVSLVDEDMEFDKDLFLWKPNFDEIVEYLVEETKQISTFFHRDSVFYAIQDNLVGHRVYDKGLSVKTIKDDCVYIGEYKFVSGSGLGNSDMVSYLMYHDSLIPTGEVFYSNRLAFAEILEEMNDYKEDMLILAYGSIIKQHLADIALKRKDLERSLSVIDKYQFITNSLNKSVSKENDRLFEAESDDPYNDNIQLFFS